MRRVILSAALSLALPLVCRAEKPGTAEKPSEPTETVVRMTVQPMAAPKPALKYQLLPEFSEMNPGNPVLGYLKCFGEANNFFYGEQIVQDREKWLTTPLKDLPLEKMEDYLFHSRPMANADFAARLDSPDWQLLLRMKRDGAMTLLPEIQQMRTLADVLKLRFRAQAAARRFDEAIAGAKTMFAMSRHLGENPTGVGAILGFAVADMTLDPLEEMLQQAGCPNLYWALTNLPTPLIDLHKALSSDRDLFALDFAQLDEATPMTDAQVQTATERFTELMRWQPDAIKKMAEFKDRLKPSTKNETAVEAARNHLIEFGLATEVVKKLPPAQAILLDAKHDYERSRDDVLKLMSVPYWQVDSELAENENEADNAGSLFSWMARQFGERKVQVCREQRIGLLRCIEALRLYAADHDGKLPAKLDELPVPQPIDPVTGKPFSYKLEGATAFLRGTPPRGKEKDARYNRRYEIAIQK